MTEVTNKIEGTVLSDKAVETTMSAIDTIQEQAKQIGRLEGEIKSLNIEHDTKESKLQSDLEKAKKEVVVTIKEEVPHTWKSGGVLGISLDYVKDMLGLNFVKKITTTNMDDITDLANEAVKADADNRVRLEVDKRKEAEKESQDAKDTLSQYKKDKADEIKKAVEKAVDDAEKSNISKINDLKAELRVANKQLDLYNMEMDNFIKERDITVEAMQEEIDHLNKMNSILSEKPSNLVKGARNYLRWRWHRLFNKFND